MWGAVGELWNVVHLKSPLGSREEISAALSKTKTRGELRRIDKEHGATFAPVCVLIPNQKCQFGRPYTDFPARAEDAKSQVFRLSWFIKSLLSSSPESISPNFAVPLPLMDKPGSVLVYY
ncbi:hypothetical protein JOB18_036563 [Solea senegalensis]|uniref:Uncharacterized protein n=1 Tax=Solea senegalensis TaxID=28829 RepID=A0AAV6T963_SOLSE|nr:hypothetical protein JOB18_036563 [Solea senegalensis]